MIRNFKNLDIWRRSRAFVKTVYIETESFPTAEKFGLTSQIRRAAISIPSNITEGCGRKSEKGLSNFLDNAIGSNCELETQIYLAHDLGFIPKEKMTSMSDEIGQIRKMTLGYQKNLTF